MELIALVVVNKLFIRLITLFINLGLVGGMFFARLLLRCKYNELVNNSDVHVL